MVSLASHLERLKSEQTVGHGVKSRNCAPLPFSPGSQLLPLGHYLVNLSVSEAEQHPSLDLRSGQPLYCKIYSLQDFQAQAPLFYRGIKGVHPILDVTKLQDKVFVFSKQPFGDLHNFLKQRKKLSEGEAANIFRQIVLLVRDAHQKDVVLRDLKLKKFVFEDPEQ